MSFERMPLAAHVEISMSVSSPDESELLDKMPLVMRTAIAVDVNLATFQKIALFQVTGQEHGLNNKLSSQSSSNLRFKSLAQTIKSSL